MLKDLIKVANRLDSLGHRKEADELDSIIKKVAQAEGLGDVYSTVGDDSDASNQSQVGMRKENLIEMEKNVPWERLGLTDVNHTEEEAVRSYVADIRGRHTGLYGYNNGSYVILPYTPGMRPKKYIKQGDGARAYSGLRQEDAMREIQNLINSLGYIDIGLPVPTDYRSILER